MGDRSDFIPIRDKQLCSDNRKCSCWAWRVSWTSKGLERFLNEGKSWTIWECSPNWELWRSRAEASEGRGRPRHYRARRGWYVDNVHQIGNDRNEGVVLLGDVDEHLAALETKGVETTGGDQTNGAINDLRELAKKEKTYLNERIHERLQILFDRGLCKDVGPQVQGLDELPVVDEVNTRRWEKKNEMYSSSLLDWRALRTRMASWRI